MQIKRNAGKIEPMASTWRRLGVMRRYGIASADLKRSFADDINALFGQ